MATNINTNTALVQVDVQTTTKTVTLPLASQFGGRLITIKDKFGSCSNYNITIETVGGNTIDGAASSYVLSNNGAAVSLVSDGNSRWMTLNSPSQPFTGSTIALSSASVTVSTLGLFDPGTGQLSNIQMSTGRFLIGGNEFGGGQSLFVSTQTLNFYDGYGSNLYVNSLFAVSSVISSLITSNVNAGMITASTFYGGMFFGDGSHLSNLIPASTTVVTPQYAFFTVSSGTEYTGEPWDTQAMQLSTMASQVSPIYLDTDGYSLRFTSKNPQMFRVSYMTGGNQDTLKTVRPTITLAKIVGANSYSYPSVENFEGGGGSVTFLDLYDSNTQLVFGMRGLSNYTFTEEDSYLYRMSFESVGGTTTDIFSTINLWTNYNRFVSTVDFDSQIRVTDLLASNANIDGPLSINGDVTALSNVTTTLSSIANAVHTNYLRVMSNAIIGSNSIILGDNNISASNVQVSTLAILDQSTMTYKALVISSGSIYLGGSLASAGGSGSGGVGGSTLSSLFVGSSSNQNFIKFWGRQGEYNNAAIVEQSTGGVTGEVLTFKGSSINDQLRFQTTGSIRFETGVSQPRDINSANQLAIPSLLINSSSNVGIMTNNPAYTLDVTGSARFTTLMSTTNLYAGAFYMGLYFA